MESWQWLWIEELIELEQTKSSNDEGYGRHQHSNCEEQIEEKVWIDGAEGTQDRDDKPS